MSSNIVGEIRRFPRRSFPIIRSEEEQPAWGQQPAWGPGPPNQWLLDILQNRKSQPVYDDPTLPLLYGPNYNPRTHSETGTPFARPWDEQDEADLLARKLAKTRKHMRSVLVQINNFQWSGK